MVYPGCLGGHTTAELRTGRDTTDIYRVTSSPLVLLVEDDTDTRRMYATWLQLLGFAVTEARDGVEGVASARAVRPSVVLMDLAMPRMDGVEATRRLKTDPATAEVPVVIFSAYTSPEDRRRAFDAGAVEFLAKPCDVELVAARLRHYAGH